MGGPNWVYCHASRRCLQRGKVMRGRYLGRIGWHKPCVPVVVMYPGCPYVGPCDFATILAEDAFGRHGATQD